MSMLLVTAVFSRPHFWQARKRLWFLATNGEAMDLYWPFSFVVVFSSSLTWYGGEA